MLYLQKKTDSNGIKKTLYKVLRIVKVLNSYSESNFYVAIKTTFPGNSIHINSLILI